MTKSQKQLLYAMMGALLLAALAVFADRVIFPAVMLYWAKSAALKPLNKMDAGARADLNLVPQAMILEAPLSGGKVSVIQWGGYKATVPEPKSSSDTPTVLILQYDKFKVRVLKPYQSDELDGPMHLMGMRDRWELLHAIHHARIDDIASQPDINSVKRVSVLLLMKSILLMQGCEQYYGEFRKPGVSGFVTGDISKSKKRTFVDFYLVPTGESGTLVFSGESGAAMPDVVHFLSAFQIEKRSPTTIAASQPTTTR